MKVNIGPFVNWVGPYQIAETLLFWMNKEEDSRVHKFGEWLSKNSKGEESWLMKICQWINKKNKRHVKVKIDPWDTWSMDSTLAMIILPMLKQLKDNQHGAGHVDDEDVPEHIRSTAAPAKENEWDTDLFWFRRWEWIMDELIWTFEQLQPDNDWEEQYYSGTADHIWIDSKDHPGCKEMIEGPNHTFKLDTEGYEKHNKRIANGLMLFGKYFRNLWD